MARKPFSVSQENRIGGGHILLDDWRRFIVPLAVFLVRVVLILYGPQPETPSE
jgi:hypothetical protein